METVLTSSRNINHTSILYTQGNKVDECKADVTLTNALLISMCVIWRSLLRVSVQSFIYATAYILYLHQVYITAYIFNDRLYTYS